MEIVSVSGRGCTSENDLACPLPRRSTACGRVARWIGLPWWQRQHPTVFKWGRDAACRVEVGRRHLMSMPRRGAGRVAVTGRDDVAGGERLDGVQSLPCMRFLSLGAALFAAGWLIRPAAAIPAARLSSAIPSNPSPLPMDRAHPGPLLLSPRRGGPAPTM